MILSLSFILISDFLQQAFLLVLVGFLIVMCVAYWTTDRRVRMTLLLFLALALAFGIIVIGEYFTTQGRWMVDLLLHTPAILASISLLVYSLQRGGLHLSLFSGALLALLALEISVALATASSYGRWERVVLSLLTTGELVFLYVGSLRYVLSRR